MKPPTTPPSSVQVTARTVTPTTSRQPRSQRLGSQGPRRHQLRAACPFADPEPATWPFPAWRAVDRAAWPKSSDSANQSNLPKSLVRAMRSRARSASSARTGLAVIAENPWPGAVGGLVLPCPGCSDIICLPVETAPPAWLSAVIGSIPALLQPRLGMPNGAVCLSPRGARHGCADRVDRGQRRPRQGRLGLLGLESEVGGRWPRQLRP